MKDNKTLFNRVAALIIVVVMLFSLTSCGLGLPIYNNMFGNGDGQNGNNNGDGDSPDGDGAGSNIGDGDFNGFYPGSGQESIEGVNDASKTLLTTVTIVCEFGTAAAAGSGVFYSVDKVNGDAYIITNHHVVYSEDYGLANEISVYLYGMEFAGYAISAEFVGGSVTYDIAVLKIENSEVIKNSYATQVTFADSDKVRVFDKVYAVGNAEGDGMSATEGIVSVESETLQLTGADGSLISLRVMRFDAAVNHGNSGGGLYNEKGQLIGIVSAKDVSADVDNMGYAIPSDLVKKLADNIIYHCDDKDNTQVNKALMGVTITASVSGLKIDNETGSVYQVELVEVIEISEGSIAQGKVQVGDIINSISIDGVGRTVTRMHHVTDFMLTARVGSTITLNVTRGGENINITFVVTQDAITLVK